MPVPKVSICMITYNHEKYIEQAVNSVLMQQCDFDFELVICNDNSLDNTDLIIKNLIKASEKGNRIKYHNHLENKGMMPNFAFALQKCSGQYIALCEGDDFWTDSLKLQKQVDFLENNLNYVLCFHKVKILENNTNLVDDFITEVPENYETIETLAKKGNYIHTPSVVFRNCIEQYPFEFLHTKIGDYFLYMILAEQGLIGYIEESMAVYRHGIGYFSGSSKVTKTRDVLILFSCLSSYLKNDEIKKIMLKRQLDSVYHFENVLHQKYQSDFKGYYELLKAKKYLKNNYKSPIKIIRAFIRRLKQ
jgi:glycosyltransferase involved in cell wall biosynthesis